MLALFRFFLAFFLGVDLDVAERLTDPSAWRNPIAQVQALAESAKNHHGQENKKGNFNAKAQRRKEGRAG